MLILPSLAAQLIVLLISQRPVHFADVQAQLVQLIVDSQIETGVVALACILFASEATTTPRRLLVTTHRAVDFELRQDALAIDARRVLERRPRDDAVPVAASLRLAPLCLHALDLRLEIEVPRRSLTFLRTRTLSIIQRRLLCR